MENIKRKKFNVSILGDRSVGKTCLIQVKIGNKFSEIQLSTIGIEHFFDKADFDDKKYNFKIFDTAGQERYNAVSSQTLKLADGYILVFSVDDRSTLERINFWIKSIENNVKIREKALILVGNKIDKERTISHEANSFAKKYKLKYFETSAKTGYGVDKAFNQIYKDIYELNKKLDKPNSQNIKLEEIKNKDNDLGKSKNRRC